METLVHIGLTNAAIATGLAVAVALVARVCRLPAVIHGLWFLVLLRLVAPPVWGVHLPWPMRPPLPNQSALQAQQETARPPAAKSQRRQSSHDSARRPPVRRETARSAIQRPGAKPTTPAGIVLRFSWETLIGLVWLAGAVVWWLIAGVRLYAFRKELRQLSPAPTAMQERMRQLANRLSLRHCPIVYLTESPTSPLLWALFGTPCLLIPAALWERLTEDQRDTMLVHELAHLRRGDHWMRRLELLVLGLYWWHPVAWWARARLQEAEEQCCDAWVVWALPDQAPAYAGALLAAAAFLSLPRPALPVGASGVGQFRLLQRRLTMILQARTPRRLTWTTAAALLACAAVALSLAPLWAQPAPQNSPQTRTTASSSRANPPTRETPRTRLPHGSVTTWLQSVPAAPDSTVEDAQDTVDLLKAQLEGKKAELQEAEALLQQAQAQLRRAENMSRAHTTSTSELEAARTDVTVKEARVRVKQAQIKEGEVRLRQAMRHLTALRRSAQPATSVPAHEAAPQPALSGSSDSSGLRALTLQLETAITWDAVSSDWHTRRDGWVKEVTQANSVPALAKLIEELEMAVLWSAVTPSWAERREGWIQDVSQARNVDQLAKLLGELEMYTTWEAVTPDWRDLRDGWITAVAKCKAL